MYGKFIKDTAGLEGSGESVIVSERTVKKLKN